MNNNIKKITIIFNNTNRYEVIGRNIVVTETSIQDLGTYFYADNVIELQTEVNKLKKEYSLNTMKSGLNGKGQKIIVLT